MEDKNGSELQGKEMEEGEVEACEDGEDGKKGSGEGLGGETVETGSEGLKEREREASREQQHQQEECGQERDVSKGSTRNSIEQMAVKDGEILVDHDREHGSREVSEQDVGWKRGGGQELGLGQRLENQIAKLEKEEEEEGEVQERIDEEEEQQQEEGEEGKAPEDEEPREKNLALTMSSTWPPLPERERGGDVRIALSAGQVVREEREREGDILREVQSETAKDRGRAREENGNLTGEKLKQKKQKLESSLLSLSPPDTSLWLASSDPGKNSKPKSSGPRSSGVAPRSPEPERSFRSYAPTQSRSNGYTNSLSLSLSHPFFHNASCSLTQNSYETREVSSESQQISQKNEHVSQGSSYRSEQFVHGNHLASEASQGRKPHRELPLYQRLLQNGNPQYLHGSVGMERTRDSGSERGSFMDERVSHGNVTVGNDQISQGSHYPQGSDQIRWDSKAILANCSEQRALSNDRRWNLHKTSHPVQQQEDWSTTPMPNGSLRERGFDQHKAMERVVVPAERDPGRGYSKDRSLISGRGVSERDLDLAAAEKSAAATDEGGGDRRKLPKVERILLHEIVSEPIPIMAKRLQEVPDSFLESLKECLQEMLVSVKNRDEFVSLQKTLQRRADLTSETLLQAHRTQLELLVALKTGIRAFLLPENPLALSALTEIFLGAKCRNFMGCQSQLPADDCECKVCSQKNGFCNACMCVVCSKFDFDANTCRWIGCDFCLHWCHTECGIQMGYISSGISTRGTDGTSVMQFRCIACDHTSELYGFVKDVFTTCGKDWAQEILVKELDCVRRIFHRSQDIKGKQLCNKAEQMLLQLDNNGNREEVCQIILQFFEESDADLPAPRSTSGSDAVAAQSREMSNHVADAVRDAIQKMNKSGGEAADLDRARSALQLYDRELEEKRNEAAELQYERAWQKAQIDELESIVQMKQADAKMYQMRADEVRQEAEGLQLIAIAKSKKIEEEYAAKLVKLRLNEAEEKRRKWYEEVQAMEKAHREYSAMKMSMVCDIHDLLKKMGAAKCQL